MARLLLIRHGQASFLADDYDHLSPLGQQQARLLGAYLTTSGLVPDRVLTGPLHRQRDTARLAASPGWPDAIELDDLTEHQGDRLLRQHLPAVIASSDELRRLAGHVALATDAPERSERVARLLDRALRRWSVGDFDSLIEPFAVFRARALRALDEATRPGARLVAVFTSGGVIGAMLGSILHCPDETVCELGLSSANTSMTEVLFTHGRRSLRSFNVTTHLDPASLSSR